MGLAAILALADTVLKIIPVYLGIKIVGGILPSVATRADYKRSLNMTYHAMKGNVAGVIISATGRVHEPGGCGLCGFEPLHLAVASNAD